MSKRVPRHLLLDYLCEYPLGEQNTQRRTKVLLNCKHAAALRQRQRFLNHDVFGWKQARRLEDREDVPSDEGVWPINYWRCNRRIGNPGSDVFPENWDLEQASGNVYAAAKSNRVLCYFRAIDSQAAKRHIQAGCEVRYAFELTSDWYDPPNGRVTMAETLNAEILGSHSVPLSQLDESEANRF